MQVNNSISKQSLYSLEKQAKTVFRMVSRAPAQNLSTDNLTTTTGSDTNAVFTYVGDVSNFFTTASFGQIPLELKINPEQEDFHLDGLDQISERLRPSLNKINHNLPAKVLGLVKAVGIDGKTQRVLKLEMEPAYGFISASSIYPLGAKFFLASAFEVAEKGPKLLKSRLTKMLAQMQSSSEQEPVSKVYAPNGKLLSERESDGSSSYYDSVTGEFVFNSDELDDSDRFEFEEGNFAALITLDGTERRREAVVEKLESLMDSLGLAEPTDCINLRYDCLRGLFKIGLGPSRSKDEITFMRIALEDTKLKAYGYFFRPRLITKEQRAKVLADTRESSAYYIKHLFNEFEDSPGEQALLRSCVENNLGQLHRGQIDFIHTHYSDDNVHYFDGGKLRSHFSEEEAQVEQINVPMEPLNEAYEFMEEVINYSANRGRRNRSIFRLNSGFNSVRDFVYVGRTDFDTTDPQTVHEFGHALVHSSAYSKEKMSDLLNVARIVTDPFAPTFGGFVTLEEDGAPVDYSEEDLLRITERVIEGVIRIPCPDDSEGQSIKSSFERELKNYSYRDFLLHVFTDKRPFRKGQAA